MLLLRPQGVIYAEGYFAQNPCWEEPPITLEMLKRIERLAYAPNYNFLQLQDAENWEDVADYAETSLKNLLILSDGRTWYAIIAKHRFPLASEFVDLAKIPGTPELDWQKILAFLRLKKIKKFSADLRTSTSYRKLKWFLSKYGDQINVEVVKDRIYYDSYFGEEMHELVIRLS